ncbi:MAG TPA: hypothetical protein VFO60_03550 [Candidatus Dormibacteraeota bacterium]|nr:hypothetical protein [Candidatus Dormibacteraeota bacterium]
MQRLLCIMGSGETAPTMTSVHADLLERVGGASARAVLLDTPYGFQENADDVTERAVAYFRTSVRHPIEVASLRDAEAAASLEAESAFELLRRAAYVFAGPGSPSYAVRQWMRLPVPDILTGLLEHGGCVVMSSAAATTVGVVALPVYEVYKVGEPPRWLPGIDLLGRSTGVAAAVVPHWDNAEGGTHDTSRCYIGERRLRVLEAALAEGAGVLGVDEHTAAVVDVAARTVEVRGRGGVTWRRDGVERRVPSGTTVGLDELVSGAGQVAASPAQPDPVDGEPSEDRLSIAAELRCARGAFEASLARRDVDAAVRAVLDLDAGLTEWVHDNPGTDELDRARAELRGMVVRLGGLAREGARDPRELVGPFVELALELRREAREQRRFGDADGVRDRLVALGVEVRDTRDGVDWLLAGPPAADEPATA